MFNPRNYLILTDFSTCVFVGAIRIFRDFRAGFAFSARRVHHTEIHHETVVRNSYGAYGEVSRCRPFGLKWPRPQSREERNYMSSQKVKRAVGLESLALAGARRT